MSEKENDLSLKSTYQLYLQTLSPDDAGVLLNQPDDQAMTQDYRSRCEWAVENLLPRVIKDLVNDRKLQLPTKGKALPYQPILCDIKRKSGTVLIKTPDGGGLLVGLFEYVRELGL